jgi:Spx/MgsR family transcriptional regulator
VITLYGIKNCDTVKKARRWLDQHGVDYRFHDFREDGLEADRVQDWVTELGWEALVNRRSTTWKQLDPALRASMDADSACSTIITHPTLIKRPLLDTGHQRLVGFSEASYTRILNRHTL